MAFSCLRATGDLSEGAPEGKVYTYKKEGGVAHEIEIHFPKDHDRSKPVPASLALSCCRLIKAKMSLLASLCLVNPT